METHERTPVDLADALMNAVNAHDASKLGDVLADDVTYWEANLPSPINGRRQVEDHFRENWRSFPDATIRLVNRVVSGDWIADEMMWSGTHKGPISAPGMTIPPTGRQAHGPAVGIARIEHGKIRHLNIYYDNLSYMAQLGLMAKP